GHLSRPGVTEIADYRRAVDAAMDELLADHLTPEVAALVELGLHHEQQHQELLLMDIKHVLGCNPLRPAYADDAAWPPAGPLGPPGTPLGSPRRQGSGEWIEHPGGVVRI